MASQPGPRWSDTYVEQTIGTLLRVVFSILAFARQRDPFYVGVTLIVLAVLLYSIVGGYAS